MKKTKNSIMNINQDKGFTLLEILIAMLILTVAILSLVSVTVMVIKGNSLNKMRNTATTLAKDQMEAVKNQAQTNFDNIVNLTETSITGFPGYERQRTVTTITGNSFCTGSAAPLPCCTGSGTGDCPDKKKNIAMQVRWQWQGNYHYVTLDTIITK
jgi:prepilin-type N-terminal cleavage/methylation domain-containing protein